MLRTRADRRPLRSVALASATLLFACAAPAFAQGRPDIAWLAGGHAQAAKCVAFSPDSTLIATAGGEDNTVKVWRASDGHLIRTCTAHSATVNAVAFSPDGQTIASASDDRTLRLWSTRDGSCIRVIGDQTRRMTAVLFAPDGGFVAGVGEGGLRIWDCRTGADGRRFEVRSWIRTMALTADGSRMVVGCDRGLGVYRTTDGNEEWWSPTDRPVSLVAYTPDGASVIANCCGPSTVRSASDGAIVREIRSGWPMAVSADAQFYAAPDPDYPLVVRVRRTADDAIVASLTRIFSSALAFSPDGSTIAHCGTDGSLLVWSRTDGHLLSPDPWPYRAVRAVAVSPASDLLAVGSVAGLCVYDLATGQSRRTIGASISPYTVGFTGDGSTVAAGLESGAVEMWRLTDGMRTATYAPHTARVLALAVSPDGALLATGGQDGKACVTRLSDGTLQWTGGPVPTDAAVRSLSFTPDSKALAYPLNTGLRLDPVAIPPSPYGFVWFETPVRCVTVAPDGRSLAACASGPEITQWSVPGGALLTTSVGHTRVISALAHAPDGLTFASCSSADGTVRIWRSSDGALLRTYDEETHGVEALVYSRDGRFLVWGRADATLVVAHNPYAAPYPVRLALAAPNALVGDRIALTATLSRALDTRPVSGQTLRFAVDGVDAGSATTGADGVASLTYLVPDALGAGDHVAAAELAASSEYAGSTATCSLAVTVCPATLELAAPLSGRIGETVLLSATLTRSPDGAPISGQSVRFLVGGSTVATIATGPDGRAATTCIIGEGAGPGAREVQALHAATIAYGEAAATGVLNVRSGTTAFSPYAAVGRAGSVVTLRTLMLASGQPVLGRTVQFAVDGLSVGQARSGATGAAMAYPVPASAPPGPHLLTVSFPGDASYSASTRTVAALTVLGNVAFSLYTVTGPAGSRVTLRSLVYCGGKPVSGLTVQFSVDGNPIGKVISDSAGASLSYGIPLASALGTHSLMISFAGNSAYAPASRTTACLTVLNARAGVSLSPCAAAGPAGGTVRLGSLMYSGGLPVLGAVVQFAVDGVVAGSATTTGSGASLNWTIPIGMAVGLHDVTVTFAGNTLLNPTSVTVTALRVGPPRASVGMSIYSAVGMPTQTVLLRSVFVSGGAPVVGRTIHFAVDGVPVGTGVSDATGVLCAFAIPPDMAPGVHSVTAAFAGDDAYSPASRTSDVLSVM